MIIAIALLILLAIWVYKDAKDRGESQPGFWALGTVLLAIITVPVWLMVRKPKGGPQKTCPFCAEQIKVDAKVCRHCGRDIPAARTQRVADGIVVDEGFYDFHRRELEVHGSSSVTDEPFYAPTHTVAARRSRPGEVLWTLRKGHESRRAELRDAGDTGCEFQLFANEEFLYGQRFLSRAAALLKAQQERTWREREGWMIVKLEQERA